MRKYQIYGQFSAELFTVRNSESLIIWKLLSQQTVTKVVIPGTVQELFCLNDQGSTDIDAVVSYVQNSNAKVEIMLGGDSELDSMIEALRWAADKLEELKNIY